ncbi:MAG: hypothetical protein HY076_00845 [Candidatus Eisenbacteria bacterium]|uniref:Uncharacterized protein n=1 Tax=Eiseniibacteriota bacterium TaxID=2212470 RepID=A0A9D6QLL1_UNCEI|nr:hypothetical protein [Candidatus Eisenbacteria bacterium]MBI3538808.1 hypothetical protein [Candidatus Eisenbacteria bacterium]
MTPRRDARGRARWITLGATTALTIGIVVALRQAGVWKPGSTSGRPQPGDQVIAQALRQVGTRDTGAAIQVGHAAGLGGPASATSRPAAPHPLPAATPGSAALPPGHPPIDSTMFKQRWIDDVRGVDVTALDSRQRELFLRFANARECTCGCGYTLAGCKASDMTCEVSGAALAALRDSVRAGRITSARGIRARAKAR